MSTNSKKNEINFNVEIGDDTSDKKHIFDLNKIFHIDLSYNFDLLKNLLLTLIKNQKEKENKITELENQILDLRIAFSEGSIKKSDEKNKEEEKVNKKEETIEKKEPKGESENQNKDTINYKINPPIKGPKLEMSDENSPIINKIIKKINGIDEYLNDTYKVIPELQKVTNEDKVRINILEENNEIANIKYEYNIDYFLISFSIYIKLLLIKFQSEDNIITYSIGNIKIKKEEAVIYANIGSVGFLYRKEKGKMFKIFNIDEETTMSIDPKENLVIMKITNPKANINLEALNNIRRSFQFLLEHN